MPATRKHFPHVSTLSRKARRTIGKLVVRWHHLATAVRAADGGPYRCDLADIDVLSMARDDAFDELVRLIGRKATLRLTWHREETLVDHEALMAAETLERQYAEADLFDFVMLRADDPALENEADWDEMETLRKAALDHRGQP